MHSRPVSSALHGPIAPHALDGMLGNQAILWTTLPCQQVLWQETLLSDTANHEIIGSNVCPQKVVTSLNCLNVLPAHLKGVTVPDELSPPLED